VDGILLADLGNAQRRPEDAWGLLLARRGRTTKVSKAGKGVGCCCMIVGHRGGIGMGGEVDMMAAGIGACVGTEDGKYGV